MLVRVYLLPLAQSAVAVAVAAAALVAGAVGVGFITKRNSPSPKHFAALA